MAPGRQQHRTPPRPISLRWKQYWVACPSRCWQSPRTGAASLTTTVSNYAILFVLQCGTDLSSGNLLSPSTFPLSPLERICQNPQLSVTEKSSFLNFIQSMVKLEPEERPSAGELLE